MSAEIGVEKTDLDAAIGEAMTKAQPAIRNFVLGFGNSGAVFADNSEWGVGANAVGGGGDIARDVSLILFQRFPTPPQKKTLQQRIASLLIREKPHSEEKAADLYRVDFNYGETTTYRSDYLLAADEQLEQVPRDSWVPVAAEDERVILDLLSDFNDRNLAAE